MHRFAQRSAANLACLAIAAGGAVWTGCGDDEVNDAIDEAQQQGEKAVEEAKTQAEEARKNIPGDAREKIDEASKEAGEAVEEAKDEAGAALDDATGGDQDKKGNDGEGGGY